MINKKLNTLEDVTMYIATQFVNVPLSNYDSRLNEALEMIGTFLNVDRVYVFDYNFELSITSNTYEWCNHGVSPEIDNLQNVSTDDLFDEWTSAHKLGQMVIYEDVKSLGPESTVYQILDPQGVLSICTIPLMNDNECIGFVGFDDIREKRSWKNQEIQLLQVLAELMVNLFIKKRNDEQLIYLRDKAQKASEAKGQFLAQMSHEIRTPLNGVYNSFYLLKKTAQTDEQKNYLEIAQTSLDALSSIVNNILDLSKIEAGKMDINYVSTDFEASLTKILKTMKPSIVQKQLVCHLDYDYNINYEIITDINKVNQMIMNLINNAIKFTQRGSITTKVTTKMIDKNEMLSIKITDTGIGIKEEDLKHISEAFYQVSNQQSATAGSGLGLSIIKELVQLMGGTLSITSIFGEGSSFEINLPLIKGEMLDFDQFANRNVLIWADDIVLTKQLSQLFSSMGFNVDHYQSAMKTNYEVIVFDDHVLFDHLDIFAIKSKYGQDTTSTFLISNNQFTDSNFDYVFDLPLSRKSIIQRLLNREVINLTSIDEMFNGHVLIVDDNFMNREALKSILSKHGLTSDTASSGLQAIEMVKHTTYNLILMDIQMPQMDGYETSRMIRNINFNKYRSPIIAVTANAFLSEYDLKMSSFMDDVIYKPVKMELLLQLLQKYLKKTESISIPQNLLVFNKHLFETIFDQNLEAGFKMIEVFQQECYKDFSKLKESFDTKDKDYIYKSLHYFKGPLSYMGGEKIMYLVNELMNKVMSNSIITDNEIIQIESELKTLYDELKGFLHENTRSR